MTFKELKSWAKNNKYEVLKEKGTERCVWTKIDNPAITGMSDTLSDCATQIYNDMTDYVWVEYQQEYIKSKSIRISQ